MTVSTETVRMAKSRPRMNQSERSDLPCHIIRWLITVLMEIESTTLNSFEKDSKMFFPSYFTVCSRPLPFHVKFKQ